MTPVRTHTDLVSIEALLDRLDPHPAGACRVPGCVHHPTERDVAAEHVPLAA